MFNGSMVALVTPMNEDGTINKQSLHDLVEWHIASKTSALIIAGTTGESATLTGDEKFELIKTVVSQAKGRIPVIAGTGTNCTQTTIESTKKAQQAGANACLIVTPYYNKPPQNGLYLHYKAVAEQIDLPIILYNVPGRTGCDLLPETVERLAALKNIIGIKEATGKIERITEIKQRCGTAFEIYSGDDATGLQAMLLGAEGVISVTTNIAPEKMHQMCEAALSGNRKLAETINNQLMLLHQRLFLEANPIPTKWALNQMGKIPAGIRLPLVSLDKRYHLEVKEALQAAGISISKIEAIG